MDHIVPGCADAHPFNITSHVDITAVTGFIVSDTMLTPSRRSSSKFSAYITTDKSPSQTC